MWFYFLSLLGMGGSPVAPTPTPTPTGLLFDLDPYNTIAIGDAEDDVIQLNPLGTIQGPLPSAS